MAPDHVDLYTRWSMELDLNTCPQGKMTTAKRKLKNKHDSLTHFGA